MEIKFLQNLINATKNMSCVYKTTNSLSNAKFEFGIRWENSPLIQARVLQFIVNSAKWDSMEVVVEPVNFLEGGNCEGDFCYSPRFTITSSDGKLNFIVNIRDITEDEVENLAHSFEYTFTESELEEIKKSSLYALNTQLGDKTNEEIASELVVIIKENGCDKFFARDEMLRYYNAEQKEINRLTWVMYNIDMLDGNGILQINDDE